MAPRRKNRWHERLNIRKQELQPIREASDEEEQFGDYEHENGLSHAVAEAADDVAEAVAATKMQQQSCCQLSTGTAFFGRLAVVGVLVVLQSFAILHWTASDNTVSSSEGPINPQQTDLAMTSSEPGRRWPPPIRPAAVMSPAPFPPVPLLSPSAPCPGIPLPLPSSPPRRTAPPLATPPVKLKCGIFCASRAPPWSAKCTWSGCAGCQPCAVQNAPNRGAPSPLHSHTIGLAYSPPSAPTPVLRRRPPATPPAVPAESQQLMDLLEEDLLVDDEELQPDSEELLSDLLAKQRPSNLSYSMSTIQELQQEWQNYRSVARGCTGRWSVGTDKAQHWWSRSRSDSLKGGTEGLTDLRSCSTIDGLRSAEKWEFQLVGPFRSNGGGDWQDVLVEDSLRVGQILSNSSSNQIRTRRRRTDVVLDNSSVRATKGGSIWVTAIGVTKVLDIGDGLYTAFDERPIRTLRSRLAVSNLDQANSDWRTILKDSLHDYFPSSRCAKTLGGGMCAFTTFPEGFGLLVDAPLAFTGAFSDVRDAGSAELQYWLEVGLRYSTRSQPMRRLNVLRIEPPFPLEVKELGAFRIPTATPSIVWAVASSSVSGRLRNIHLHTKLSKGFVEAWLVSATPDQLGLTHNEDLDPVSCSPARVPCGESGHCESLEETKASILQSMANTSIEFRCIATRPPSYSSTDGDVQPDWRCFEGAERVTAGSHMTLVAFFDPRQADAFLQPWLNWEHQFLSFQGWFDEDDSDTSFSGIFMPTRSSYNPGVAAGDKCHSQNASVQFCSDVSTNEDAKATPISSNCAASSCILAPALSRQMRQRCKALGAYDVEWKD